MEGNNKNKTIERENPISVFFYKIRIVYIEIRVSNANIVLKRRQKYCLSFTFRIMNQEILNLPPILVLKFGLPKN